MTKIKRFKFDRFSFSTFSITKQTFFAKRLSFLIKSGVPMLESMQVLRAQAGTKVENSVLERIIEDISNGQSLANSLAKFKSTFGNLTINVIRAGEASGTLVQNLSYLADELKKREILRRKIKSALLYPVIVTIATFGIVGFLTAYIFPKIMPIFQSVKVELPFTTKTVIFFSKMFRDHGFVIFILVFLFVTGYFLLKKHVRRVRLLNDKLVLKLPIFGSIVKNYNLANTLRTFGILLRSGVSLNETLSITTETTENTQYQKAFKEMRIEIMNGKTMSKSINQYEFLFPSMVVHMVAVGEKSGNLANTFSYLSEYYEHEFDEQTKNLSSTIEPVLMIIMGLLVGFVAISVITPIYELTNNLSK